jgi:hypothetical protein
VRGLAQARFEAAMTDVAMLYANTYGHAVQSIQMAPPALPDLPAPIALGQTIALDFNDGWWISWWNRIRGFNAFSKRFQNLIARETEDFMAQSKGIQTEQVRALATTCLREFFEEHDVIMQDISAAPQTAEIEKLFQGGEEGQKRAQLEALTMQFDGLLKDRSVAAEGIMP